MRRAGLSIDVDSVSSHLEGYGIESAGDDGSAYRLAVPRALEILERCGARATFFLIAREAERHPESVVEIVRRGHEVASHSMTHRLPFADLDDTALDVELAGSKRVLEELAGQSVAGFRAPSWDLSDRLLSAVVAAGYRYDASTYPSILLPLLRRAVARRSAQGASRTVSGAWAGAFGRTGVHRRRSEDGQLTEVPMCTAPFLRLPYYQTMRFVLPRPFFVLLRAVAHARRGAISYQFHAVDFLGLEEDRLDPAIGRHPGMGLSLAAKLGLASEAVSALGRGRWVVPLVEVVEDRLGGGESA